MLILLTGCGASLRSPDKAQNEPLDISFKFENEEMANFYTKSGLFNIGRLIATINKWLSDSSPVGKNLKSV